MVKKYLCVIITLLAMSQAAWAIDAAHGFCETGNQTVAVGGLTSSTRVQRSYPSCTVTVYITGTVTLATIYSDNASTPTPLANPFTATATGAWKFFAANGTYDVVLSGGGLASPVTTAAISLLDPNVSTGKVLDCSSPNYSGATADAKISACITALPSTGGTADARGLQGSQSWVTCPTTGVTKPVDLILGSGTTTVSVSCTIPTSVTLFLGQGAILSNTGNTLTINGGMQATLSQHFAGTGTLEFMNGGMAGRNYVVPAEWCGAVGDGSTTDSTAIQRCGSAVDGSEGTLKLRSAQYCLTAALTFTNIRIVGEGVGSNLIAGAIASCAGIGANNVLTINAGGRNGLLLQDFQITGTSTQVDGIEVNDAHDWRIESVRVNTVGGTGFQINASYSGLMLNCSVSTADRALELQRVGSAGSGGVTVSGFLSGDITSRGISVIASTSVTLVNPEINVYGASGIGLYVAGTASVKQLGLSVSGGLLTGELYPVQLGEAGTLAVEGVSIVGATISGCVIPTCVGTSGVNSAGIRIVSGLVKGCDIRGNYIQLVGSAVRTTGAISDDCELGRNSIANLVAPTYYLNSNGTQVTDTNGADLNGRPFSSAMCNHVFVSGTSSVKCGYSASRIYSSNAAVGNIGAGTDNLMVYPIPSGFFAANRTMEVKFSGYTAANANVKTVACYWGAQLLFTDGATAANNRPWSATATFTGGTNSAFIEISNHYWNNANVVNSYVAFAGNISDTRDIYCTGIGTADNDIVQGSLIVRLDP